MNQAASRPWRIHPKISRSHDSTANNALKADHIQTAKHVRNRTRTNVEWTTHGARLTLRFAARWQALRRHLRGCSCCSNCCVLVDRAKANAITNSKIGFSSSAVVCSLRFQNEIQVYMFTCANCELLQCDTRSCSRWRWATVIMTSREPFACKLSFADLRYLPSSQTCDTVSIVSPQCANPSDVRRLASAAAPPYLCWSRE